MPRSLLEFCCAPEVVDRSSGTGMGSSPSSGVSLTGGLSFPADTNQSLSFWQVLSAARKTSVPGLHLDGARTAWRGTVLWINTSLLGQTHISLSRSEYHCQALNKHQRTKIYKRKTTIKSKTISVTLAIPGTKLLRKYWWYIIGPMWWCFSKQTGFQIFSIHFVDTDLFLQFYLWG